MNTNHIVFISSIALFQGKVAGQLGIYVKSLVPGGAAALDGWLQPAAALDGWLQPGDQLTEVNGHSLLGVTEEM